MADLIRKTLLLAAAGLLAACGGAEGETSSGTTTTGAVVSADDSYLFEDDYILGDVNAPVTLLEYASVACPACARWHAGVLPDVRKKYIETGKVRYVFRPYPTSPVQMADTGHMLAYCGKRDDYFTNIKLQFDRQSQLLDMLQKGKGREAYVSLAKASGLSEEQFVACMRDETIRDRYNTVIQAGEDLGVAGTPSFFVNGEKVRAYTIEQLDEIILPLLGEPVPEKTDAPDADGTD